MSYALSAVFLLIDLMIIASPATADVLPLSTSKTFSCVANGNLLWIVNGVSAAQLSNIGIIQHNDEHLGGGLVRRNLTVHVREEHNNAQLQCIAFTGPEGDLVKEVNITIQGLLLSPSSVTTTNGSSSIHLSWTAPFTLDITGVDPDISHYTVYITNLNTRRVGEKNVTGTKFIFTGLPGEDTPDPCHTYQFTVSAWNVVGEGNRSEPVYGHSIAGTFGVQNATVQVSDSDNSVTVTCRFAESSMVIGCHVKLVPNNGSCAQKQNINVRRMGGQNIGIKTVPIPNGIYRAHVHDHESDGSISPNSAINLTEPIVVGEPSSECRQAPQPTGTGPTTPSYSTPPDDESRKKFPIGAVIGVGVVTMVIIGVSIVVIVIFIKTRQRHIKVNTVDTADPNLYVESNPVKHTTQTDRARRPPQGHASAPLRSESSSSDSRSGSSPSSQSTDVDSPPQYSKLNHGITAGGHQDQVTSPEDYERVNLQQPKPVARFNAPQGTQGLTYAALGPARQPAPVRHDQESMPYTQIDFRAMAAKAVHQKSRLSPPVQPD